MFAKKAIQKKEEPHPDPRVASIEKESGISFADVKIHYASDKPKEFGALAYAYGNNVYLESGQEKHLKHELGHVVQQRQGIVSPTHYEKGYPVNINSVLEQKADRLSIPSSKSIMQKVIQKKLIPYQIADYIFELKSRPRFDIASTGCKATLSPRRNELALKDFLVRAGKMTIADDYDNIGQFVNIILNEFRDEPDSSYTTPPPKAASTIIQRTVDEEEYRQILDKNGLIRNSSPKNAIWVGTPSAKSNVIHQFLVIFGLSQPLNSCGRFIDITSTGNDGEASYPDSIIYKLGTEDGCFGIGAKVIDVLNTGIRIIDHGEIGKDIDFL